VTPNLVGPTAKELERRGLFGALPFRRIPKNVLLTKSPPSTSTRSSLSLGALFGANSLSDTSSTTTATMTLQSFHTAHTSLRQPSLARIDER
jgi:hypothetical protein